MKKVSIACDHGGLDLKNAIIKHYKNVYEFIDCGTNEELFLALAEYDKKLVRNQWFICQEEYLGNNLRVVPVGEWQKNTSRDKLTYSLKRLWRKATIEEIIEHFK